MFLHKSLSKTSSSNNTYKEFIEALQSLTSKGMKKLILDLRDNGGGILE
ncbi:MAG: hypothetical protein EBU73_08560, partial [Chitinophagia bacterium]|nr:hypothetical protein [Chitinophagia bacterium]